MGSVGKLSIKKPKIPIEKYELNTLYFHSSNYVFQ